jgi:hypothetical protein
MEEMKWFGSALLGVLAVNSLGFGYRLWLKSAKLLASSSATGTWMACPKSDTHSLLNIVTSLIGPIWRK